MTRLVGLQILSPVYFIFITHLCATDQGLSANSPDNIEPNIDITKRSISDLGSSDHRTFKFPFIEEADKYGLGTIKDDEKLDLETSADDRTYFETGDTITDSLESAMDKRRALPMGFASQLGKRDFLDKEDKRAPMGFMGQLGKRFNADGLTESDGYEQDKRIPMGFASQLGKRTPSQFEEESYQKRLPMGFASQLGKRIPMGFTSQLGKRVPMGFTSQLGKRIPMGFTSQLGKRVPMGFTSQLGKRVPMGFTSQLGKRVPMGFTSQLGKRLPMGFASQLGKRAHLDISDYDNVEQADEIDIDSNTRQKRLAEEKWRLSRRHPKGRYVRGLDRYSFVSRLGKRSLRSDLSL